MGDPGHSGVQAAATSNISSRPNGSGYPLSVPAVPPPLQGGQGEVKPSKADIPTLNLPYLFPFIYLLSLSLPRPSQVASTSPWLFYQVSSDLFSKSSSVMSFLLFL